jgi:bis(5'-nucleosyl)-tetraphosphatase (symmetrical)
MASYVVGDVQGCFHSFQRLLQKIAFRPGQDQLWLVGDIINRGAGSLEMLRWAYEHQNSLVMVLGNHDLHTIAVAEGFVPLHKTDTLQALLDAPDAEHLLTWLRHQPLIHQDRGLLMVHAGLLPQWSVDEAMALAGEVESALRGAEYRIFFSQMYGNQPAQWHSSLAGIDRLRLITNVMTRIRTCTIEGEMNFKFSGQLGDIPSGFHPWFDVPQRRSVEATVVFGHWSALGLQMRPNLYALDTGCLWGGELTAMRLEDRAIFQVPCAPEDSPRQI